MGLYPTSAWPLRHLISLFDKQLAPLALQSVLQCYVMMYVFPVIVLPPTPPPPPSTFTSSAKTIMHKSNYRLQHDDLHVCRSASRLHTFVKGENLCTEPSCNTASSLMRPAGIRAPHCQCAVKELSDRGGGWIGLRKQNHTICQPYL